jgi:hypothetical protein
MRSVLASSDRRNNRNQRLDLFKETLTAIRQYCEKSEENMANRYLVCGICPLSHGLAINIRQLRTLLEKCKSSINGSFQRMGYATFPIKDSVLRDFLSKLPMLKDKINDLREWSVRATQPIPPVTTRTVIPTTHLTQPAIASALLNREGDTWTDIDGFFLPAQSVPRPHDASGPPS